jgi:pimeloyl-ACP methyl ester carboxylesterase
MAPAEQFTVDVEGSEIGVVRWPASPGRPTAVAIHGITANSWSWAVVARHLAEDPNGAIGLLGVDLRGRGGSANASPQYGMRRHADDVAAVATLLGLAPAVVVGHSMGTWVALMCAERHPGAVSRLVLVDGGVALPIPDGIDPQAVLDATLGPAIARLRQVWPDRVSYRAMWEQHPAFAGGLGPEVERYVLSDLVPAEGGFRSCVREDAVRHDGAELLTDEEVRTALDRHAEPVQILRAELGLFAAPPPMIPVEYEEHYPRHAWTTVPGSNHYDILVGDAGAGAVASAIAGALNDRA